MRLLLLAHALALAAAAVFAAPAAAQQQPAASPCADSLYQSLRAKPLQDLSEREYEYFMQREKACTDYQTLNRVVNAPRPAAPAPTGRGARPRRRTRCTTPRPGSTRGSRAGC